MSFAMGADVIGAIVGTGVMTEIVGSLVIGANDGGSVPSFCSKSVVGDMVG